MTRREIGFVDEMRHQPKPPSSTLTGPWRIEGATPGDEIEIGQRPGRVWTLQIRHRATDVVEYVRCRALATTTYTAGQEVDGHLYRDREGVWFRRDYPARSAA